MESCKKHKNMFRNEKHDDILLLETQALNFVILCQFHLQASLTKKNIFPSFEKYKTIIIFSSFEKYKTLIIIFSSSGDIKTITWSSSASLTKLIHVFLFVLNKPEL